MFNKLATEDDSFFVSCVIGWLGLGMGICYGIYCRRKCKTLFIKNLIHIGMVKEDTLNMDMETALIIDPVGSDSATIRISMDYFPYGIESIRSDKLIIVGDMVKDASDQKWLFPCTDTWSGIYTYRHPISFFMS